MLSPKSLVSVFGDVLANESFAFQVVATLHVCEFPRRWKHPAVRSIIKHSCLPLIAHSSPLDTSLVVPAVHPGNTSPPLVCDRVTPVSHIRRRLNLSLGRCCVDGCLVIEFGRSLRCRATVPEVTVGLFMPTHIIRLLLFA